MSARSSKSPGTGTNAGHAAFSIRGIVLTLIVFYSMLALLGAVAQILLYRQPNLTGIDSFHDLFWVDGDADVWTWASSFAFLLCALLLLVHWAIARQHNRRHSWGWLGLAALFVAFSIDDVARVYERSERALTSLPDTGVFHFQWVLLAIPFTVIVGLLYLRFFVALPGWVRLRVFLAAVLAVGGGVGLEMGSSYLAWRYGDGVAYRANTWVEECVEQAGIILFAIVLLQYLAAQAADFRVHFTADRLTCHIAAAPTTAGPPVNDRSTKLPVAAVSSSAS